MRILTSIVLVVTSLLGGNSFGQGGNFGFYVNYPFSLSSDIESLSPTSGVYYTANQEWRIDHVRGCQGDQVCLESAYDGGDCILETVATSFRQTTGITVHFEAYATVVKPGNEAYLRSKEWLQIHLLDADGFVDSDSIVFGELGSQTFTGTHTIGRSNEGGGIYQEFVSEFVFDRPTNLTNATVAICGVSSRIFSLKSFDLQVYTTPSIGGQ